MIEFKSGNIFKEDVEAVVNTVNCVGVMGRGIALQFKKNFPDNFKAYEKACLDKQVKLGQMFVHETGKMMGPKFIINFPTKNHWRAKSRIEDIEEGLEDLQLVIQTHQIKSLAMPPLGCGLGGLDWKLVRAAICNIFRDSEDLSLIVFEPSGIPKTEEIKYSAKSPQMTPGRAALIVLMNQYLEGLLDPFISLLEIHKLMYFMQIAGEKLSLKYKKANYGPYAENLRHVFNALEGHMIKGYGDGGDNPDKSIELIPNITKKAKLFLKDNESTKLRFEKVTNLVDGFETPFGLELLATVHWVVKEEANDLKGLVNKVYDWNSGKQKFSEKQIHLAYERLKQFNWL